jgi:hypothetical protein
MIPVGLPRRIGEMTLLLKAICRNTRLYWGRICAIRVLFDQM